MFSVRQKREIADKVQQILRDTAHPELPAGEIQFALRVVGAESWSRALTIAAVLALIAIMVALDMCSLRTWVIG